MTTEKLMITQRPKCSFSENDEALTASIALPGVKKDDVKLSSEGNILTVTASRENPIEESMSLISKTSAPDNYQVSWEVDSEYDLSQTEAKFEKNVLLLTVPVVEKKQLNLKVT